MNTQTGSAIQNDDGRAIDLLFQRSEEGLELIRAKYGRYMLKVSDNILKCKEDAEECVSDMLSEVWRLIPPHRPDNLKMFLAKIVRNISLNRKNAKQAAKRGGKHTALSLDDDSFYISCPDDMESETALKQSINDFLAALPSQDRNVFLMRYFFFDDIGVIARSLHLTKNHVYVILSRTKAKLKKQLQEEGYQL